MNSEFSLYNYMYMYAAKLSDEALLGGLYVPHLNFKPFHIAISEGSHVAVGISSKAIDIAIIGNV